MSVKVIAFKGTERFLLDTSHNGHNCTIRLFWMKKGEGIVKMYENLRASSSPNMKITSFKMITDKWNCRRTTETPEIEYCINDILVF